MEPSPKNTEMPISGKTIGAFLREEREKKGLNYDQICELTRLRPPILKALEDESWDSLPSPVFVCGFVRSYSHALGLEEERIMALFRESGPCEIGAPKPLVEPIKNTKNFFIIILVILVLLALASAFFFWKGHATFNNFSVKSMLTHLTEKEPMELTIIKEIPREIEPVTLSEQFPSADPAPETNSEAGNLPQTANLPEIQMSTMDSPVIAAFDATTPSTELILKASIREMTWLRIFVDDQDPKEYIFRPQEHFEWKAKKGFDLLIGNRGGIDLAINGVRVENQGTSGQVVHLTLPKGYERRHQQE